ncbi:MAG: hypothetical protein ABFD64_02760 [Armatimonadota bacterium]
MPHITIVKPKFAEAVRDALAGISANQASYKTGVSDEYIRKMAAGRVPSKAIIEKFANGLDSDLHKLLVAAGYEEPGNPVEGIENVIAKYRIEGKLTPEKQERIMKYVREVIEDVDGQEDIEE